MAKEYEKKFLIKEDSHLYFDKSKFLSSFNSIEEMINLIKKKGTKIKQGYLSIDVGVNIAQKLKLSYDFNPTEARLRDKGGTYYFTLKGAGSAIRNEREIQISQEIFESNWDKTSGKRVEKIRLKKSLGNYTAEIDYYTDRDLIVIEVEVNNEIELNNIPLLGKDITFDSKYKNKNLANIIKS